MCVSIACVDFKQLRSTQQIIGSVGGERRARDRNMATQKIILP